MGNELFEMRRSVRRFREEAVPEALVEQLLAAAVEAPSGGNCQPWHFYVARGDEMKKKLRDAAYGQPFIGKAPLVIVVCTEAALSAGRYGDRGRDLYCLQDTAAAVENILLCAAQNGLGACWCGAFDEVEASRAMSLPASRRPVAILPIGYPADKGKKPKRRPMKDVVTYLD